MRDCHESSKEDFERMAEEIMEMCSILYLQGASEEQVKKEIMEYLSVAFDMGGSYWTA